MGCASSAPFASEIKDEIKEVTGNMVEAGEHALHDFGEATGKTIHEAVDRTKGAITTATHSVQDAVGGLGGAAEKKIASVADDAKTEVNRILGNDTKKDKDKDENVRLVRLKSVDKKDAVKENGEEEMHDDDDEEFKRAVDEIMGDDAPMFRPTPAPSIDSQLAPSATTTTAAAKLAPEGGGGEEKKPPEVAVAAAPPHPASIADEMALKLAEQLIQETQDAAAAAEAEELEALENPADLECDLPPTKWEALADVMVELPPRMSIDLGTGQLYKIVDDDPLGGRAKFYKSSTTIMKELETTKAVAL